MKMFREKFRSEFDACLGDASNERMEALPRSERADIPDNCEILSVVLQRVCCSMDRKRNGFVATS